MYLHYLDYINIYITLYTNMDIISRTNTNKLNY